MVKWLVDVRITRRQLMQHVFSMNEELLFSSKRTEQVFEWLHENNERVVECITEDRTYWLSLSLKSDVTKP